MYKLNTNIDQGLIAKCIFDLEKAKDLEQRFPYNSAIGNLTIFYEWEFIENFLKNHNYTHKYINGTFANWTLKIKSWDNFLKEAIGFHIKLLNGFLYIQADPTEWIENWKRWIELQFFA